MRAFFSFPVFDSDDENNLSYTDIHKKYQMMVETLLDSFISDIGIDSKVFLEACVTHTDKHAQSTTVRMLRKFTV